MKNLFLFVLAAIILTSCYKDDASPSGSSMRIKHILGYDSDHNETMKMEFEYSDSKVTNYKMFEKNSDGEYSLLASYEYSYSDNKITEYYSEFYNDIPEFSNVTEKIFNNNKIVEESEILMNGETFVNSQTWNYSYSGDKLIAWLQTYTDEFESDKLDEKSTISYNGDNIKNRISSDYYFNEWHETEKDEYHYSGNLITEIIAYRSNITQWMESMKTSYTYSQNRLDSYTLSFYEENTWNEFISLYYEYDNNGLPVRLTYDNDNYFVYEYETGTGNASQILYSPRYDIQPSIKIKSAGQGSKVSLPDAVARVIK